KRLLEGRTDFKIRRSKVVGHKETLIETVKSSLREDGLNLAKRDKNYQVDAHIHDKEKHYAHDVELIDVDVWEDRSGGGKFSQTAIYKSPHAEDFRQR